MINESKRRADVILERAITNKVGKVGGGYKDNKAYIDLDDLLCLLGLQDNGTKVLRLDHKQKGLGYVHEVMYKEYCFILATCESLVHVIVRNYCALRKDPYSLISDLIPFSDSSETAIMDESTLSMPGYE